MEKDIQKFEENEEDSIDKEGLDKREKHKRFSSIT